jgi:uncharacterized protein
MTPAGRAFWLRQLHLWHWMSAAVSLIGMIAFAVTGITLNHAADIPTKPKVTTLEGALPEALLQRLQNTQADDASLPDEIRAWLQTELGLRVGAESAEWSEDEVYLALPRPGGDAWLAIDRATGDAIYEATSRGWVSYFNDLHKGRSTGTAWRWFIDVFAAACVVFSLTGLILLQFHAGARPSTWPLVGLGFAGPLLLIILFMH